MTRLRTLGIVPARAGSKRVPRKNLRLLGGRPLVEHVIEAGRGAGCLDVLAVSSDDEEVLAIAARHTDVRPIRRPPELATDTAPAIDYVRHTLAVLEGEGQAAFDAVVILQPSSPLTLAEDVRATVSLLAESGADTAVSVMKLDHAIHPVKLKRLVGDKLMPFLEEENGRMAAHELPELYVRNCAVYATRRHVVEAGKIIGDDCRGYVMPRERSVDINDEIDMSFVTFLFDNGKARPTAVTD